MQDETPPERLRRSEAAAYARRRLGQSVTPNTLRSWPVPYRQVGRDAVYEISDLDRFIDARLAAAPRRRAPIDSAAVYESRRRLLAQHGEGRLRALEAVVLACSRDRNCSLDEGKSWFWPPSPKRKSQSEPALRTPAVL